MYDAETSECGDRDVQKTPRDRLETETTTLLLMQFYWFKFVLCHHRKWQKNASSLQKKHACIIFSMQFERW